MSYQTKIEIGAWAIGLSLSALVATGIMEVAKRMQPTVAGVLFMLGGMFLGAVAIQRFMDYLRERAGL